MKKLVIIIPFIILTVLSAQVNAQKSKLMIKDKETSHPIQNVIYYYDNKKGYSDEAGEIVVDFKENQELTLSHISHNSVVIIGEDLSEALVAGYVEMTNAAPIMLNAVSVYAIKEKKPVESVHLKNADWVHHDAGQVLQQIPGFDAVRKSIFGFDPVFRGFKLDQLNILYDGALQATAACPNRMDPPTSQIAINQVSEIEVTKGPHSFRFGPTLGATINFKSAPPVFIDTMRISGRINSGFESNGEVYRNEGQLGFRNHNSEVAVMGSYSKGHNYKDGGGNFIPAKLSRATIGLKADFQTGPQKLLSFSANRNFARNTDFPTLMMDLLEDDTWMMQARYKVDKSNNWYSSWNSQIYSSFVDHRMNNSFRNPTSVLAETNANTKNIGGRTEVTIRNKQSLIYLGFDGKFENISGHRERSMLMGPNEGKTMTDSVWQDGQLLHGGIFADLLRQTGKYKLSISGRLDLVSADAGSPSKSFSLLYPKISATDLNTSFSAGISRQWSSDWFTGIWIGRGVRSANITERYINSLPVGRDPYEMMGNPALKPEANNQVDLIVSYKRANTNLELSTYYSVVDHYISSFINTDMAPKFGAPGVRQFTNIKAAKLYGFEFTWFQIWIPQFNNQLRIAYINGQNSTTDMPLAEISPMNISYRVEGNFLNNRLIPYFEIRHSMKQNRIAKDYGENETDAFTVSDLGIRMIALKSLLVSVGVNNIFDKKYREHLSRYISPSQPLFSAGRSLIMNISFSF